VAEQQEFRQEGLLYRDPRRISGDRSEQVIVRFVIGHHRQGFEAETLHALDCRRREVLRKKTGNRFKIGRVKRKVAEKQLATRKEQGDESGGIVQVILRNRFLNPRPGGVVIVVDEDDSIRPRQIECELHVVEGMGDQMASVDAEHRKTPGFRKYSVGIAFAEPQRIGTQNPYCTSVHTASRQIILKCLETAMTGIVQIEFLHIEDINRVVLCDRVHGLDQPDEEFSLEHPDLGDGTGVAPGSDALGKGLNRLPEVRYAPPVHGCKRPVQVLT